MTHRARRVTGELSFVGLIFALLLFVLYDAATSLAEIGAASGDAFSNAAMFPRIIVGLMALVACAIVVSVFRSTPSAPDRRDPGGEASERHTLRLILFLLIVAGYVALFRAGGYYVTTGVTLLLLLWLFRTRSVVALILVPVGITLTVGFVFEILFNVVLPLGWFGLTLQPLLR
jgi:hypothetical protein